MNNFPEENLPEHSPLGASGSYRWMKCPGSVSLSRGIKDPESEYAVEGTAAHELAQMCLRADFDAWHYVGMTVRDSQIFNTKNFDNKRNAKAIEKAGVKVDKDMADAVQVYLDHIRWSYPRRNEGNSGIEYFFHCPKLHPLFYGQSDFYFVDHACRTLHVYDYKHGAGIVVDVKTNTQGMYYGVGVLQSLCLWDLVETVVIHIAQPRGWHSDGPLRHWAISTDNLKAWLRGVLLPAMKLAETSTATESGEHCRFCPSRGYACPQILKDFDELEELMNLAVKKGGAKNLTNLQLGRFLTLFDVAKIVNKAASVNAFARMNAGKKVPGRKLAHKRMNREWKEGAEAAAKLMFGKRAYTASKLLSPAQIEAMPEGEQITARYAFKPDGGLIVVAAGDARVAVNKDVKSLFTDQTKKRKK